MDSAERDVLRVQSGRPNHGRSHDAPIDEHERQDHGSADREDAGGDPSDLWNESSHDEAKADSTRQKPEQRRVSPRIRTAPARATRRAERQVQAPRLPSQMDEYRADPEPQEEREISPGRRV